MNVNKKLKDLGKGNKIQIKRQEFYTTDTPAQYQPNTDVGKRGPETHKFCKSIRTSSVLSAALHKETNVDMGDPTFTMLKTNMAPGY